jgi:hypothetical protein
MFNRKASIKEWLNSYTIELESEFKERLKNKINDSVMDLAESIQQMATIIDLKIKSSPTVLDDEHKIFGEIASRRSGVLRELQDAFARFLSNSDNFTDSDLFPQAGQLAPNIATGSGLALVGMILATVTNGMVFDITGGVLTAVGLVFAGVSLGVQKRRIVRKIKEEFNKGRQHLETELSEKLKTYVDHLRSRINDNFAGFDEMLEIEGRELESFREKLLGVEEKRTDLTRHIDQLIKTFESSRQNQD